MHAPPCYKNNFKVLLWCCWQFIYIKFQPGSKYWNSHYCLDPWALTSRGVQLLEDLITKETLWTTILWDFHSKIPPMIHISTKCLVIDFWPWLALHQICMHLDQSHFNSCCTLQPDQISLSRTCGAWYKKLNMKRIFYIISKLFMIFHLHHFELIPNSLDFVLINSKTQGSLVW